MRSLRRLAAALLVLSSCQDGGEPLSTLVIPGPDVPRESPGVDPNPAPSPPVIGVVTSGQADLHVWPAGDMTSASLAPPDLDAFGLQAALSIQLVRWESGEPLFYEVADEANAVLVRRDEAGTLHRLRTRSVTSPTRTLAANGRWEVWWDGGLMVQSTAMGAEPRRYPVPDALNAPREVFAWGDDLIYLPPPDLGTGPKVGAGSWQWAITKSCANPDGAFAFINYLLQPENIGKISNATGLIPGRSTAVPFSDAYKEGAPLAGITAFPSNFAEIRPPTPAYSNISVKFEEAAMAIANGANVQDTLDDAVTAIDADISANDGYGFE